MTTPTADRVTLVLLLLLAAPAAVVQAISTSTNMLVHTPRFAHHTENGLLLWSWGRCGTGTFWDTLRETLRASGIEMRSICDRKEGVSYSHLTPNHVDECLSRIPSSSVFFNHLKPKFLEHSAWPTPYDAIKAMKERGAKVLVVLQRPNWLARDISAMEDRVTKLLLATGHDHRKSCDVPIIAHSQCPGNCTASWEKYDEKVQEGLAAGKALGIRMLTATYDKNDWPCKIVEQSLRAMVEEGALEKMPNPPCVVASSHNGRLSHIQGASTMDDKIGKCTAKAIRKELTGTKHEWMLDLEKQLPDNFDGGNFKEL
mmetsp:Transcript_28717/g.80840  ORF Transcript_28717/g.80840 Transcript_28717/m.80840 type:complete len:314 (-) Transcript_28717:233-1174(-)|eukprot:CAMPEP_0117673232 /NCGR_PEP_ID=MMETSP0804-20121206/14357_1 /TAXON_ID=1074897 /ORGANISM="Tetraselmis astigmatica, Strain CCMP880" /LENGTH=313 /DNA_ID=CAMNT_0005481945 /DNA_START=127 /DNA_END=1068 /DNA_ORIENTATION=-